MSPKPLVKAGTLGLLVSCHRCIHDHKFDGRARPGGTRKCSHLAVVQASCIVAVFVGKLCQATISCIPVAARVLNVAGRRAYKSSARRTRKQGLCVVCAGSSLGASVSPSTSSAPSPAPVKANETLPNILPVAATTARTAVLNRTGAVSTSSLGTSTYCGYSDCGSNCDEYAASQSLATYGDWGWYSFSAVQSYTCTDGSYQYYCCIESCTSSYDCPGVYLCDASDHCHLPSASPPPPPVYSPQGYASPTSNAIVSTAQTGCEAGTCDCQCDKANLGSAVFVGTYPVRSSADWPCMLPCMNSQHGD